MKSIQSANELDLTNNQSIKPFIAIAGKTIEPIENNQISEILTSEGHDDLVEYVEELGLARDPNIVVLSSLHHYYYDADEMKNVRTVINLKVLNQVKEIKNLLNSIFSILPQRSNLIGCFVDNKKVNGYELRNTPISSTRKISNNELENGIVSGIPFINMLYSIMDSKTNKYMSAVSVASLLEDHGFKVLNMKEINGVTYFHSQKIASPDN